MNTVKGYEKLVAVYQDAHDQAAKGKGDERHANGQPFHEQRMQQISGLLRSSDGMAFQAIKKLTEGLQFEDHARREAELLGALNYVAGIVIYYREAINEAAFDTGIPVSAAFKDACEYTLEQVIGDEQLSDWAKWVAVSPNGDVCEYEHRPIPLSKWNSEGGSRYRRVNKVVPPINFKNCLFEVSE